MVNAGYKVGFAYQDVRCGRVTPENPPMFGVNFTKGELVVWAIMPPNHIQTAYLINGRYVNHHPFKSVDEFFKNGERPSHLVVSK